MNYNVLKKHPERPQQSLKCTARVKRWSPVDLANLTPNSLLTSKKHWDEEFNVSLLVVLAKVTFAMWTAVNHCFLWEKVFSLWFSKMAETWSLLLDRTQTHTESYKLVEVKHGQDKERISGWILTLLDWVVILKCLFLKDWQGTAAETRGSGTGALLPSYSTTPLLDCLFQATLRCLSTACSCTPNHSRQGETEPCSAPGYFEISHQSAKKLPRRASKKQNHYLITINLNKNGL